MSIYLGTAEIASLKLGTADVLRVMLGNAEVWSAVDPDAADYFARIVSAGSSISVANKAAVDAFVRGCKTDGIWTAIKASCLLAGPDNLTGALVPLVGAAPTNNGFVSGDYSRTTGLIGNGTSKYLNSNRNNNADPQNDFSAGIYVASAAISVSLGLGAGAAASGASTIGAFTANVRNRNLDGTGPSLSGFSGYCGTSRPSSAGYTRRVNGTTTSVTQTSQTPLNGAIAIFATREASANIVGHTNARMSFYHIGESLDLALLDARLATYMSALI
jgi:hypothetical protein